MISHINAMLEQMAGCVNTIATQSLSLAIAVESTTLTQKLQEMMGRWKDYIPFHECSDVNFHYWHNHLSHTYSAMKCSRAVQDGAYESPHHPDTPFRLALLADFKRMRKRTGGEMETTVKHYVQYTDELLEMLSTMSVADDRQCRAKLDSAALKTLHSQYDDYLCMVLKAESQLSDMDLEMKIKPWMNTYFKVLAEQPFMVYCIDMAMDNLPQAYRHLRIGMANPVINCKDRMVYLSEFLRNERFFKAYSKQCFRLADTIAAQCPGDDGHTLLYGQMLAAQERFAEAVTQFKAFLKTDRSQYSVWEALLICESQLPDSTEALLEDARQAAELFPLHLRPYVILVQEYLRRNNCEKARYYLERCHMIAPNETTIKQLTQQCEQQCQ